MTKNDKFITSALSKKNKFITFKAENNYNSRTIETRFAAHSFLHDNNNVYGIEKDGPGLLKTDFAKTIYFENKNDILFGGHILLLKNGIKLTTGYQSGIDNKFSIFYIKEDNFQLEIEKIDEIHLGTKPHDIAFIDDNLILLAVSNNLSAESYLILYDLNKKIVLKSVAINNNFKIRHINIYQDYLILTFNKYDGGGKVVDFAIGLVSTNDFASLDIQYIYPFQAENGQPLSLDHSTVSRSKNFFYVCFYIRNCIIELNLDNFIFKKIDSFQPAGIFFVNGSGCSLGGSSITSLATNKMLKNFEEVQYFTGHICEII